MKQTNKPYKNCKICSKLPSTLNINLENNQKNPDSISEFKILLEKKEVSTHEVDHRKIMQCQICNSYYYFYYGFDNEDSPSIPITSIAQIKRWSVKKAKEELAEIKKE